MLGRMVGIKNKPVTIHGHVVPRRHYTWWAILYVLIFVGLPITLVMAVLDVIGWAIVTQLFGASCYGVGCLF
jgi:hypothetical protein